MLAILIEVLDNGIRGLLLHIQAFVCFVYHEIPDIWYDFPLENGFDMVK